MEKRIELLPLGKFLLFRCAAVFCAILFINDGASGQGRLQPFSADRITTANGKTTTQKIYAIEKAFRVEREVEGKKQVEITRFDRSVLWRLKPADNTYVVVHTQRDWKYPGESIGNEWAYLMYYNLIPGFTDFARKLQGATVQRESLGPEQVGPYNCDKLLVRVTFKDMVYVGNEWAAKELGGLVVKAQDEKGEWLTEFQNIRIGPQDPSLFEIPKDYKKDFEGYFIAESNAKTPK